MINLPYTYKVYHLPTNRFYYGVRYGNKVSPVNDLWNYYFTSSAEVKLLIKEYGKESFSTEVRKIFSNREEAIAWEYKVLKKVMRWPNCMNKCCWPAMLHTTQHYSDAGKKGGRALAKRKKECGFTDAELAGRKKAVETIRRNGPTQKNILANEQTAARRRNGEWTEDEIAGYEKLTSRRRSGDYTENELKGFEKQSRTRSKGHWATDGTCNKFVLKGNEPPTGFSKGFSRKKHNKPRD